MGTPFWDSNLNLIMRTPSRMSHSDLFDIIISFSFCVCGKVYLYCLSSQKCCIIGIIGLLLGFNKLYTSSPFRILFSFS